MKPAEVLDKTEEFNRDIQKLAERSVLWMGAASRTAQFSTTPPVWDSPVLCGVHSAVVEHHQKMVGLSSEVRQAALRLVDLLKLCGHHKGIVAALVESFPVSDGSKDNGGTTGI